MMASKISACFIQVDDQQDSRLIEKLQGSGADVVHHGALGKHTSAVSKVDDHLSKEIEAQQHHVGSGTSTDYVHHGRVDFDSSAHTNVN